MDVLAPLMIVAVALPMRLANIGSYSGKGDEGIRAEQLLLMAVGFRPVKDVFASQGPLSLDIFLPFYLLLGQTLAGAPLPGGEGAGAGPVPAGSAGTGGADRGRGGPGPAAAR